MNTFSVDWHTINPFQNSRHNAFEELCVQLARREVPPHTRFVRNGTPDAGVECYAIFEDGTEWAWQSKYFDSLGKSQWTQLDESVGTALKKHPFLKQFFVCIPLDLPDPRIQGKSFSKNKWDDYVAKWCTDSPHTEFVLWGSSELLDRLSRTENAGIVRFWFGKYMFDNTWFNERLDEAISAAGPRYTPEAHVGLPLARNFETFGRTKAFVARLKSHAIPVRESAQYAERIGERPFRQEEYRLWISIEKLLTEFSDLTITPTDTAPIKRLLTASQTATEAADMVAARFQEGISHSLRPQEDEHLGAMRRPDSFNEQRSSFTKLRTELQKAYDSIRNAIQLTDANVLLLTGEAGVGKTHLLCDVASQRNAAGQPTVLLMGQRFGTTDQPWAQIRNQLDLPEFSLGDFIDTIACAAEVANQRAFIIIDALNEGAGRSVWPTHLEAFLTQISRSPWIGTIISVRTPYEELVLPSAVRKNTPTLTHNGFDRLSYDAIKTYSRYYNLELPTTPYLNQEFTNPLSLKTLCEGLREQDRTRLPNHKGITILFRHFIDAVNTRLATQLGFDPKGRIVGQALDTIAAAMCGPSMRRWLPRQEAQTIVNAVLPNRDFEYSLFRGLIVEGVLTEGTTSVVRTSHEDDIIYFSYERLGDHLIAKNLLDTHFDSSSPSTAFGKNGGLAFISDRIDQVAPGLLEALWIQVAEVCGEELIILAPQIANSRNAGPAFLGSITWRATTAFSKSTYQAVESMCRRKTDIQMTLDALLTVAILPQHPLNARFLNQRLCELSMAERDAWWSIYLHGAWGKTGGPVQRLVDWGSSVDSEARLDDELVLLAGTTLTWMLSSSNRSLRDRATKALVNLYTGRLKDIEVLLLQFYEVDDPYIRERVYAAAYGVSMRCQNPVELGPLAQAVYDLVFASGSPPVHILLRDYARGVVERAILMGSHLNVQVNLIQPPYNSQWPNIPTESTINKLLQKAEDHGHEKREEDWSRKRIASSVLIDDFARYVIGTNSPSGNPWLSLTVDDKSWERPPTRKQLFLELIEHLTPNEQTAFDNCYQMGAEFESAAERFVGDWWAETRDSNIQPTSEEIDALLRDFYEDGMQKPLPIKAGHTIAKETFTSTLSTENHERIIEISRATSENRTPPRLGLAQVQRYILNRVFEMGWTTNRFGDFDRFEARAMSPTSDREPTRTERIGKKYQWIAYHEVFALVADRFQLLEDDHGSQYLGPWQNNFRDIDPSCMLRSTQRGTPWSAHSQAWWEPGRYFDWPIAGEFEDWVIRNEDLPKLEDLLRVHCADDGVEWWNIQCSFLWQQDIPADRSPQDMERGEIRYDCTGYLLRCTDVDAFFQWAEGVDFQRQTTMPTPTVVDRVFLGEYSCSTAADHFERRNGWVIPAGDCPVPIRTAALNYMRASHKLDASLDDDYELYLPAKEILHDLNLRWSGNGADFIDKGDRLAVYDPTVHEPGPSSLLLRTDLLQKLRERTNITVAWAVTGEKRILRRHGDDKYFPTIQITGAYVVGESGLKGFVKRVFDDPNQSPREPRLLETYRVK